MFGLTRRTLATTGARATLVASALVAFFAISGIGATSAMAVENCTPLNNMLTKGQGSSLQKVAQENWTSTWNAACAPEKGKGSEIEYKSSSSGTGLKAWGVGGGAIEREWSYIGTDDAPNAGQIEEINKAAGAGSTLQVVPVAQAAIAIVAHPPAGCTLTNITRTDLEKVFRGTILNWSEISTASGTCGSAITRVVRADSSGTTYQFKHYLFENNTANLPCLTTTKWTKLQEPSLNTTWPESCGTTLSAVMHSKAGGTGAEGTGSGGGDEVKTINETTGSIGYAALADAENNRTKEKEGKPTVVTLDVQNGTSAGEPTFATPAMGTMSNCDETQYEVPEAARKEGSSNVDWSGVYGGHKTAVNYPICTLTWDLAFTNYATAGFSTEGTGHVTETYITEILKTYGKHLTEAGKYYALLPATGVEATDVQKAAEFATKQIN